MKLGTKMGVGFGILIAIACLLGGLAVYNMTSVTVESEKLAKEYVPEVRLANNVERNALDATCQIGAFALSGEEQYLQKGLASLGETDKWIGECDTLANNSEHLVKLKDAVKTCQNNAQKYRGLVTSLVEKNEALNQQREQLYENATAYMDACASFLTAQNTAFKKDLSTATGEDSARDRNLRYGNRRPSLQFQGTGDRGHRLDRKGGWGTRSTP